MLSGGELGPMAPRHQGTGRSSIERKRPATKQAHFNSKNQTPFDHRSFARNSTNPLRPTAHLPQGLRRRFTAALRRGGQARQRPGGQRLGQARLGARGDQRLKGRGKRAGRRPSRGDPTVSTAYGMLGALYVGVAN